jgi:signal transduction histidine kinase/CheY-like chemotaxis protein
VSSPPSDKAHDGSGRLERCIRDLAALNALPSLCIGRSPDETLAIVLDALPTALSCDLVYLSVSGRLSKERASFAGRTIDESGLATLRATPTSESADTRPLELPPFGELWCVEAELPVGSARGRLVVGRAAPWDRDTDRVLVRSAANLVGTALEAAQVLEAARRKDDFLAMLGHELRNPLAPIAAAVELLGRYPAAAREREVIERHTRHLARLVDDLLDIARVTHGDLELKAEPVTLASILERAVEMVTPLVTRQRHTLRVDPGAPSMVQGDPVRLAQIFGNLLSNSAKFTPAGGHIDVTAVPLSGHVRVTIRDDGRGIAPDQLRRIFEPFVQAGREGDALRGGLGLGLAIVHDLVARHGGTITVESEGLGHGAVFTVELPTIAYEERSEELPPQAPIAARAGVRVLVVDDNVDVAELLAEALSDLGFQTAVAHDAHGALVEWRTFEPHAAVLDLGMPELDGYELARRVRTEHGRRPTLIAATGYGQTNDRVRSEAAGFDLHLVKPVSVRELVGALDERLVSHIGLQKPPRR